MFCGFIAKKKMFLKLIRILSKSLLRLKHSFKKIIDNIVTLFTLCSNATNIVKGDNWTELNLTPWPEPASELYRPSDRRLSAKLVPTLAYRSVPRAQRDGSLRPYSRLSRPEKGITDSGKRNKVFVLFLLYIQECDDRFSVLNLHFVYPPRFNSTIKETM
jgi:hypothetical protein